MSLIQIGEGISFPDKYWTHEFQEIFPTELLRILKTLHLELNPTRLHLLGERLERQKAFDKGEVPQFLPRDSDAVKGTWRVKPIPLELMTRRVEITGPVNSAKMVINMLSRNESGARADMAMLDFEDSMKPSFENVLNGYKNVIAAVAGNLTFAAPNPSGKEEKVYKLDPQDMAYVMVRARGLHLEESNFQIGGTPISAGLLDLVTCFYHTYPIYKTQNKTPKYYIPKCEHYLEARWWNTLFTRLENLLNLELGTIRATFLIETLPAAFQVEEILFEVRDHAVGLNVGRWDKIFSDIKVLRNHPDRIMADRSSISMMKPWMENYAKRIIKICHERGAFAMGGMSAFTPGKTKELREIQTQKVREDKMREASWGHDGCWVSHPYFIGIAMEAFKTSHQLHRTLPDFDKYSDLLPKAEGPKTLEGLRTNIRVGIAYMHGWNKDIGCVAFDNLMEDLATLEISRAQTWQWLHHKVILDDGTSVTPGLVSSIFREECEKIAQEFDPQERIDLMKASDEAMGIFLQEKLPDFLTTASQLVHN